VARFVAKENIPIGGVLAANRGSTVEGDWVEANGLQDYVVGENTKEAREIKAEITGRPVSDFETSSGTTTGTRRSAPDSTKEA
jgi:hypothetical protein